MEKAGGLRARRGSAGDWHFAAPPALVTTMSGLGTDRQVQADRGRMAHPLVHGIFGERFFDDLKTGAAQEVLVTEIRPNFEGARKTALRICEMGIKATLISDNMVAFCIWEGRVERLVLSYQGMSREALEVVVGTDLYFLMARYHGLPVSFYPSSVQFSGQGDEEDLFHACGIRIAPRGIKGWVPLISLIPLGEMGEGPARADQDGVFHLKPSV